MAALGLAACSDGGGGATAATPASGITSAATSAATEPASPSDAVPTARGRPADAGRRRHGLPRRDLGARAAAGPGLRRPADGGDRPGRQAVEVHVLLVARKGQDRRGVELGRGRPETPREVFSVTKSVTSTLVGMAQADGDLESRTGPRYIDEWRGTPSRTVTIRDILSNVSGRFWDIGTDYGDLPAGRGPHAVRDRPRPGVPAGQGLGLQQRRHPDLDRVVSTATGGDPRVRRERLFGPIGMTAHPDDRRPGGQHQRVLRHPDHVRGPGPVRLPVPPHGRWGDDQVVPGRG